MKNKTHELQRIRYLNVNRSFISHQSIFDFKTILKFDFKIIKTYIFQFITRKFLFLILFRYFCYFEFFLLFNANVN